MKALDFSGEWRINCSSYLPEALNAPAEAARILAMRFKLSLQTWVGDQTKTRFLNRRDTSMISLLLRPKQEKGFTLTELLTCLAIIAVLASITTSSVLNAKRKGQNVQCVANLRQLGIALSQFVSSHEEFPLYLNPHLFKEKNEAHAQFWRAAIALEGMNIQEQQVFTTDYDVGVWDCPRALRPQQWPSNRGYADYGYNAYGLGDPTLSFGLGARGEALNDPTPVRASDVATPSAMLAIGDGFLGWRDIVEDGVDIVWRNPKAKNFLNSTKRAQTRHEGNGNYVFVDGHVDHVTIFKLFTETTASTLKLWNSDNPDGF